jgi:hypothetical protein
MNDRQFFSLISNSNFISSSLIPFTHKRLMDMFDRRELPEFDNCKKKKIFKKKKKVKKKNKLLKKKR